jgi:predicted dehydrogenase
MDKLRVAVVGGAGDWGRYYTRAFDLHKDCEIIALVDTARERRREFAEHYRIKREYDYVEELLKDEVPDIISAVVPVSVAHDIVIACAEAGVKAVSCEKPIAANLKEADEMVDVCRQRGVAFGCGTALYEMLYLSEISQWLKDGNIGTFKSASIPSGIHRQISGLGCVLFSFLRFLTRNEAVWAEGWTLPDEGAFSTDDCGAYGRIGMDGGFECRLPGPEEHIHRLTFVSLEGSDGHVWLNRPHPILIQGADVQSGPVYPDFFKVMERFPMKNMFVRLVDDLVCCVREGGEAPCSGHDYRQALEISCALKLSAAEGHRRINLPLEERDFTIKPIPYRMHGGDVVGWEAINQSTPTIVE